MNGGKKLWIKGSAKCPKFNVNVFRQSNPGPPVTPLSKATPLNQVTSFLGLAVGLPSLVEDLLTLTLKP